MATDLTELQNRPSLSAPRKGWDVRRVADTASRERGVDVEAALDGKQLLIEVKGYPSTTYASGDRAGETKRTSAPLQARAYFSDALLAGVLLRADHETARGRARVPGQGDVPHAGSPVRADARFGANRALACERRGGVEVVAA